MHTQIESLHLAQNVLQHAIKIDPSFADAYALLAYVYIMEAANVQQNGPENLAKSEKFARRAVALQPDSLEGLVALGLFLTESGRNQEAIEILQRAVTLAPNSSLAWDTLGYVYHYAGLDVSAEKAYLRSMELDPTTTRSHWMHARMLLSLGRAHEAEMEVREALTANPNQFKAMGYLADFLYYQGRIDEAEPVVAKAVEMGRDSGDNSPRIVAGFVYASKNQRDRIDKDLLQEKPSDEVDGDAAYWIGGIHSLLGEREEALAWLRRTVALGNHDYPWFERDKNWDKLRDDPEYQGIMNEVRQHWEQYKQAFGKT